MTPDARPRLSKTKFMSGRQCHKKLWWEIHDPGAKELETDPFTRFQLDRGAEVGAVARTYVPGGVLIDVPHMEGERRLRETAGALKKGAKLLYEPAFEHEGVLVLADILKRVRGGWILIEVKSSTKVKPEHLPDLAVQTHVLQRAGIEVRRAELMHLNRECRHPDLSNLFTRQDCTDEVRELLPDIPGEIRTLKRVVSGPLPDVEPGAQCTDPHECPFLDRCWDEPPRHAIETLYRLGGARRDEFERRGFRTLLDLPEDEPLTAIQERQRAAARKNGMVVDPGLGPALEKLKGPMAYLDFESIAPPIPVWEGCRPYDPVPVQVSVHREGPGGKLVHQEWLAEGPGDPRETLAMKVLAFTRGARCILAYNARFEQQCIRGLGEHLPHLAGPLEEVAGRMVDLLPLVRDHVYHPGFQGSFGLKNVVPALVPGLNYEELEIGEGGEASQVLFNLLLRGDGMKKPERVRLRRDLLKYCETDTLALVRLHRRLQALAR